MSAAKFAAELEAFRLRCESRVRETFVGATDRVQASLVEGSPLTGAPGQPVDLGTLKNSFVPQFTSGETWETTTNLVYAPLIEDGVSGKGTPLTLRSKVGGFHSAKLTRAGWERIVDDAAKAAGGGA